LDQLPQEMSALSKQFAWLVARGYLLKGTRALMWGRTQEGAAYFTEAIRRQAVSDSTLMQQLAHQLLSYENEFGFKAGLSIMQKLEFNLKKLPHRPGTRSLRSLYMVNGAFESYQVGKYANVSPRILCAISADPRFIANRGVWAILVRSLNASLRGMGKGREESNANEYHPI
jgi:hypothetical protein